MKRRPGILLLLILLFAAPAKTRAQRLWNDATYQLGYATDSTSLPGAPVYRLRLFNRTKAPLQFLAYTCRDAAGLVYNTDCWKDGQQRQCRTQTPVIIEVAPGAFYDWHARFERKGACGDAELQWLQFRLCKPKVKQNTGAIAGPLPAFDTLLLYGQYMGGPRADPFPWLEAARPKILDYAFLDSSRQRPDDVSGYHFYTERGDSLTIRSGRLALSTLEGAGRAQPLPLHFPKGRFAVEWAMNYPDLDDTSGARVIAFARVRFTEAPVARWAFATHPDLPLRGPDGLNASTCLPVESHFGFFMFGDAEDLRALAAAAALNLAPFQKDGSVPATFHGRYRNRRRSVLLSAGSLWGCGAFVGYDAQGRICRLLVSSGLFVYTPAWY